VPRAFEELIHQLTAAWLAGHGQSGIISMTVGLSGKTTGGKISVPLNIQAKAFHLYDELGIQGESRL